MNGKKNILVSDSIHERLCKATINKETFEQTVNRLLDVYDAAKEVGLVV